MERLAQHKMVKKGGSENFRDTRAHPRKTVIRAIDDCVSFIKIHSYYTHYDCARTGRRKKKIPENISENNAVLIKKTVDFIEENRAHATLVVETHRNAVKLVQELKDEPAAKIEKS
jgi:hypothetical protein